MKTLVFIFALFITSIFSVFAQDMSDVVYLKNGDHYKGTIIENVPNDYIRIELQGGSVFTIHYSDIAKFTKEKFSEAEKLPEQRSLQQSDNLYAGNSSKSFFITPYIKIGYLITSPNANDLDFHSTDGASLDQYLDMDNSNFGGGFQIFFDVNSIFKLGADIGYQKLFSSRFEIPYNDYQIFYDYHLDAEQDLYILGLAEFNLISAPVPVYLQAGPGIHYIFWQWEYHYSDIYQNDENQSSDSATNFGLTAVIGAKIPLGSFQIPLFLRIDQIFRYGSTITGSIGAGLTF